MLDSIPPAATSYEQHGVTVVTASGDFDIASLHLIRDPLLQGLATGNRLVLDLSQTTFVDSTVLGALVRASKGAQQAGGWLRLVAPRPNVRRVLRMMALDTIMTIHGSVEEATSGSPAEASVVAPG